MTVDDPKKDELGACTEALIVILKDGALMLWTMEDGEKYGQGIVLGMKDFS